jgi:hypothetical protein
MGRHGQRSCQIAQGYAAGVYRSGAQKPDAEDELVDHGRQDLGGAASEQEFNRGEPATAYPQGWCIAFLFSTIN